MAPTTRAQARKAKQQATAKVDPTPVQASDSDGDTAVQPRPFAGVIGFRDSIGRTSVGTTEVEHLRLRCVGYVTATDLFCLLKWANC